jgi:hypothetical protein
VTETRKGNQVKINAHVFQAAATIYESIIAHRDVKVPNDPALATEAKELAELLFRATNGDGIYTLAAARCLCGFKLNGVSSHATKQELVNLALHGAHYLVSAFKNQPVVAAPMPQPVQQPAIPPSPFPVMPPAPMMAPMMPIVPEPPPPPPLAPPPIDIPDFTTEAP